jgi:N-formylglutamate amidohydrolase
MHSGEIIQCEPELDPAFEILEPKRLALPLVFNSPHSGTVYPAKFLAASRLDSFALRRSEDTHADSLFLGAGELGAPLMRARFPRCYLDVNREPYELDPRMFDGRLPPIANTRSMRVAGGLGTIPRLVGEGHEIYALQGLLARARRHFGLSVLVDCHSMPSTARVGDTPSAADFVIGDRFGTSCASAIADVVCYELERSGYSVCRNKPYAGGFITEHYGNPAGNSHAIQIEVNRALYLNERTLELDSGFAQARQALRGVMSAIAAQSLSVLAGGRLAAE